MTGNEQDLRLELLNTLLTTPHRDLKSIYPFHQELIDQDPRFYVHMASWYADEGEVRDHKEMFVVNLVLSDFPGHRDVAWRFCDRCRPIRWVVCLTLSKARYCVAGSGGAGPPTS